MAEETKNVFVVAFWCHWNESVFKFNLVKFFKCMHVLLVEDDLVLHLRKYVSTLHM